MNLVRILHIPNVGWAVAWRQPTAISYAILDEAAQGLQVNKSGFALGYPINAGPKLARAGDRVILGASAQPGAYLFSFLPLDSDPFQSPKTWDDEVAGALVADPGPGSRVVYARETTGSKYDFTWYGDDALSSPLPYSLIWAGTVPAMVLRSSSQVVMTSNQSGQLKVGLVSFGNDTPDATHDLAQGVAQRQPSLVVADLNGNGDFYGVAFTLLGGEVRLAYGRVRRMSPLFGWRATKNEPPCSVVRVATQEVSLNCERP